MFGSNYQELANTYSAMGAMLDAGVDLFSVFEFQEESGIEKIRAKRIGIRIRSGSSLHFALKAERFPPMEVALIKAGEHSGELVSVFKLLGDYYSDRANLDRTLKSALVKPVFLFSFAIVSTALPPFVLGYLSALQFVFLTGVPIAILIAILFLFFEIVWRATRNPDLDRWLDHHFANLPAGQLLSGPIAEERFFFSFLISIKAGANVESLTEILTLVADHPLLKGAASHIPALAPKEGLAAALDASDLFSHEIISGIRVGEKTGRLEQQLHIILKECRGKIDYRLKEFREWAPRILYALIAVFVALNILVIGFRKV